MKRRLKVECTGVRCNDRPMIRLKGKWLRACGISEDSHVIVSNPSPGVLVLSLDIREVSVSPAYASDPLPYLG